MNNTINKTVKKYNMLSNGDRVLVACSGGADSMLMLNYFLTVKDQYNLDIVVAHVEHGIRGNASCDDAKFVKRFCEENGVVYHQLSIDAVNESKSLGMGVEAYSRQRRYAFFDSIDCDKIATAHNLNDNVETALFRLARGTGLKGVCAIPPVRGKIIRPLLACSSQAIREYCSINNIPYRVDCTNSDNAYSRNYIRNVLIPSFENVNSDFISNMSAFISAAAEDSDFIEQYAQEQFAKICMDGKLNLDLLNEHNVSVKKRIIIKYFKEYGISLDRLHLENVLSLTECRGRQQLTGSKFAVSDGAFLRYADYESGQKSFPFISNVLRKSEFVTKDIDFYCDCDKIIGSVIIRTRNAGDRISPQGRGCTKTLKKLFNELKILPEHRDSLAVAADDLGVIGIIGYCVDERVAVSEETENILSIRLLSED